MNWIQVVYFKLKEIWLLISPAKAKKPSLFFTSLVASFVPSRARGDHMVTQSLE